MSTEREAQLGSNSGASQHPLVLHRQTEEILSALKDGLLLVGAHYRVSYANPAAREVLRYDAEDLVGVDFRALFATPTPGSDEQSGQRALLEAIDAGERATEPCARLRREDGSAFPAEVRIAPFTEEERCVGALVTFRDISDRVASQEAERRLAAILEATPDFVVSTDPYGRLVYTNASFRKAAGDRSLEGTSFGVLLKQDSAREVLSVGISTALELGSWQGETTLVLRDGSERVLSQVLIAHRSPRGELIGLSSLGRDVTEEKRVGRAQRYLAEASRLLAAELELQATLDQVARLPIPSLADLCLVAVSRNGRLVQVAQAHRDPDRVHLLKGHAEASTDASVVGLYSVLRTGRAELIPKMSDAWLWAAAGGPEHFERLRALGLRSLLLLPLTIRGRCIGVIAFGSLSRTFSDDDLLLGEELAVRASQAIENARLYDEAVAATRLREEMLNVVSHDLRNPLMAVTLAARSLLGLLDRTDASDASDARKQAERILQATERAVGLIEDLLTVGKIEGAGLPIEKRLLSSRELVEEAVELHRPLAEAAGLRIEASVEEPLPDIEADRGRLQQVFSNLIGNAIKFTPAGGTIEIRAVADNRRVIFAIADTGQGIRADHLAHIFDRFWQASQRKGSIGLGLAISRGIVVSHGGGIEATSEPGRGSTFTFWIPLESGPDGRPSDPR